MFQNENQQEGKPFEFPKAATNNVGNHTVMNGMVPENRDNLPFQMPVQSIYLSSTSIIIH